MPNRLLDFLSPARKEKIKGSIGMGPKPRTRDIYLGDDNVDDTINEILRVRNVLKKPAQKAPKR